MKNLYLLIFSISLIFASNPMSAKEPIAAFIGAEGFGATAVGGSKGPVLLVTRLDDNPKKPDKGSLRWAINQSGPRVVKFAVAGTIQLKDHLVISKPFLTIDGFDAPGDGICLRDYSLIIRDTHDIIVRHIRIRRGDIEVLKEVEKQKIPRPKGSEGLDCVSIDRSKNIIFDHCSLSWSCDEIFGIVQSENVTVQWCLLAEPLANPKIHPYGDRHAYGINASANTLSVHHCLFAHYVMRGPQFEANDVDEDIDYDIRMEAINNLLFDYESSGSRYTTGIENNPDKAKNTRFQFQFINNLYINADDQKPEIEATTRWGVIKQLKVFISGNIGPHRFDHNQNQWDGVFISQDTPILKADSKVRAQLARDLLFKAPIPVTVDEVEVIYDKLLQEVGCYKRRDEVDNRIIQDVANRSFSGIVKSQNDVGGWPELQP